ncbi:unannotated protein [freshwater metagenome]|uniref:Unannotated protein n=1 Tax=freshwater metagenome TaxID=449393 RepID=A0A6J6ZZ42_9ZZZZ
MLDGFCLGRLEGGRRNGGDRSMGDGRLGHYCSCTRSLLGRKQHFDFSVGNLSHADSELGGSLGHPSGLVVGCRIWFVLCSVLHTPCTHHYWSSALGWPCSCWLKARTNGPNYKSIYTKCSLDRLGDCCCCMVTTCTRRCPTSGRKCSLSSRRDISSATERGGLRISTSNCLGVGDTTSMGRDHKEFCPGRKR